MSLWFEGEKTVKGQEESFAGYVCGKVIIKVSAENDPFWEQLK